jgi:dGTPase
MSGLAGYAASSELSRGRVHQEDPPGLRSQFQRDRDRIIHSAAFRRLEYKTQVFVNHEGDMFRTRLTHSIEVSQIGRTIARALSLNEDLTEAICLAHDLGHTPFGHAGQDALNECMQEHGGFEHNLQSLRVVDLLEERYAAFPGLNLMFETREGIIKHCSQKNAATLGEVGARFLLGTQPGLEAQIANIADEIAYNNHDVDDGLRSGLITMEQLTTCRLFQEHYETMQKKWPELPQRKMTHELVRRMINSLAVDLVNTSREKIMSFNPATIEDVRGAGEVLIELSDNMQNMQLELKRFLRENLYKHEHVRNMTDMARKTVSVLFDGYVAEPTMLPASVSTGLPANGNRSGGTDPYRRIADYIAGMTDRFALSEYRRLTGQVKC